jgi:hypothetical protein
MVLMERQHFRFGEMEVRNFPVFLLSGVLNEIGLRQIWYRNLACHQLGLKEDGLRSCLQARGLGVVHKGFLKIDRDITLCVAALLGQHTYHRHAKVPPLAQETAASRTLACSRLGNESTDGDSSLGASSKRFNTAMRGFHMEATASRGMPQKLDQHRGKKNRHRTLSNCSKSSNLQRLPYRLIFIHLSPPSPHNLAGSVVHLSSAIVPKSLSLFGPPPLPCKASQSLFTAVSGLHLHERCIFGSSFPSKHCMMYLPTTGMCMKP